MANDLRLAAARRLTDNTQRIRARHPHGQLIDEIAAGRIDIHLARTALSNQLDPLRGQLIEWGYCACAARLTNSEPMMGDGFSLAAEILAYLPDETPPADYHLAIEGLVDRLAGATLREDRFHYGMFGLIGMLLLETPDGIDLRHQMYDGYPPPKIIRVPPGTPATDFDYPADSVTYTLYGTPIRLGVGRGFDPPDDYEGDADDNEDPGQNTT